MFDGFFPASNDNHPTSDSFCWVSDDNYPTSDCIYWASEIIVQRAMILIEDPVISIGGMIPFIENAMFFVLFTRLVNM